MVGRRSFPIGFRKLFRGELLNFGDENYVHIYIYIHVWNTLKTEITKPQHEHPLTQFHTKFPPKASQVCFPNWPQWRGRFMEVQTHQQNTAPTAPDKYHGESAGGAAQLTSKDLQFSSDDPKNLTTWQMAILGEPQMFEKFELLRKTIIIYILYIICFF